MQYRRGAGVNPADEESVCVSQVGLHNFVRDLFVSLGARKDRAEIVADVLVTADLWGVRSHGVEYNIRDIYVPGILAGTINPDPNLSIVHEDAATATLDGDHGLGHIVGHEAMMVAITKAAGNGVSAIAVRNSTHFGMAGYYSQVAAKAGMLGLALTNAPARVLPTFGTVPMLGTNPIAFASPGLEGPLSIDFATSTFSLTRLETERRPKRLPKSWVADDVGSPTTSVRRANALLPLGGAGTDNGGHKGYGLALMVDVLAGLLSGAGYSAELQPSTVGHFFLAIDIARFQPIDDFIRHQEEMATRLRLSPAVAGSRVQVPGDREQDNAQRAAESGISLRRSTFEYFQRLAAEHHFAHLALRSG